MQLSERERERETGTNREKNASQIIFFSGEFITLEPIITIKGN